VPIANNERLDQTKSAAHYQNPVFDASFPDPFVFKFGDRYYGYSTGLTQTGELAFPVITSRDLVTWEQLTGAMQLLPTLPPHYWAPEATYSNGRFYLYYSCGNEIHMEVRVATSDRPDGGFVDSGVRLTDADFAIDPHIFVDSDGTRYLFYATDFLTHTHIGTGTVVDRLIDWFELEGKPRPVTRARFDWQVYDPRRAEKGNVRWHTVEGPTVLKRKGKYFQMFSGGNWQNSSYGVAYAVTDDLKREGEWDQPIDGLDTFPILRSRDGEILGPGHNSVVLGPNSREYFCVYHSWSGGHRVMSIDRMDIVGDRMILLGPTNSVQPKPFEPRRAYEAAQATSVIQIDSVNFLLKSTFRLGKENGSCEFRVATADGRPWASLHFGTRNAFVELGSESHSLTYPDGISPYEFQNVGLETNEGVLILTLNDIPWFREIMIGDCGLLSLTTAVRDAEILNVDLTEGFVDLFETAASSSGWKEIVTGRSIDSGDGSLELLNLETSEERVSVAAKGACFENFEFAVNLCGLDVVERSTPAYGFAFLSESDSIELQVDILGSGEMSTNFTEGDGTQKKLPAAFSAVNLHQFRFVKLDGFLRLDCEGYQLAEINVGTRRGRMGIVYYRGGVSIEMARSIRIEV
jgi:GH43 family beta-xylosidase